MYICYEHLKLRVMENKKSVMELSKIANEFLAHCGGEGINTDLFWSVDTNSSNQSIKIFAESKLGLNSKLSKICEGNDQKYDPKLGCVEFKYGDYIIIRVF